jgi:Lamin Tail Domain
VLSFSRDEPPPVDIFPVPEHPRLCLGAISASTPVQASETVKVDIVSVIGAGTAASEVVVIKNNGTNSFNLNGWMLKNGNGQTYTFPSFTIYSGATVQVHTTSGKDTFSDVYWDLKASVWKSGETATLYDPQENGRSSYRIP